MDMDEGAMNFQVPCWRCGTEMSLSSGIPCRYENGCGYLFCSPECASCHHLHDGEPTPAASDSGPGGEQATGGVSRRAWLGEEPEEQEAEYLDELDDAQMPAPAEHEGPGYHVSSWDRLCMCYRCFLLPKKVDPNVITSLFASDHGLSAICIKMTCDGTELTNPWHPVSGMKIQLSHDDGRRLDPTGFYIKRVYYDGLSRIMMLPPRVNTYALKQLIAKDMGGNPHEADRFDLVLNRSPLPSIWEVDDDAMDIDLVML